jgi:hypothetical protein
MDILTADGADYLPKVDARTEGHIRQDELLLIFRFLLLGIIFALLFLFDDGDFEATV